MSNQQLIAVTGAFGYSGQYIAKRLFDAGHRVRNLTNSPDRASPLRDHVETHKLAFDNPEALADSLRGVHALINTYWVRFNRAGFQHSVAVDHTQRLFRAAKAAGLRRVVHVSITNPSEDSPLEYFSGKARLERALRESGMSYAILRPTVLFGKQDILINNIAWILRHFPFFGLFGDGSYRLQPVYVDDLAALAVEQSKADSNVVIDAIGPETFTYRELVETIARTIGKRRPLIPLPPRLATGIGWGLGKILGDVVTTREEIAGLMSGLLYTESSSPCPTKFTDWLNANAETVGRHYASELKRRRDRRRSYEEL